jgi:hypothetical protein
MARQKNLDGGPVVNKARKSASSRNSMSSSISFKKRERIGLEMVHIITGSVSCEIVEKP